MKSPATPGASGRSHRTAAASASDPALAAPRYAAAWAALVYLAGTFLLGFPALYGKFLVSPISDQYIGGYAVREFGTSVLKHTGHWPMWNPYLFGGMPYVGAMNGDIFYPTFLLRLFLPADIAVTWAFVIHIFLAGWLTYFFLRATRLGFWGSLIGGLAYMMGGPIASYVSPGHDGKLYVSALFPLLLLLILRGIRDGKRQAWPLIVLTIGLSILTPHPQLLQYQMIGAGLFALYLAFWSGTYSVAERKIAWRRFGATIGSMALGLAIGAIQFLPVAQYVAFSPRAGGGNGGMTGYAFSASYSMPPEEVVNTYLPQFTGILENYWGRTGIHFHSEYLGAVVLVLMGCAFFGMPAERRRLTWFWLALGVLGLLWSLGGYTPFFELIYFLVPGTKFFRAPAAFFFIVGFAVAALVGEGVERVLERKVGMRYVAIWTAVAAFIAILAFAGPLTTIAEGLADGRVMDRVADNAPALRLGALRCFVVVALTGLVILLSYMHRARPRLVAIMLAVLVAVDLWSVERLYWNFMPSASTVYASDAAIDSVLKQTAGSPGRVLAVPITEDMAQRDPELLGDALMIHRVRSVLGYHGNQIHRYNVLLDKDNAQIPYEFAYSPQAWRLLNVRYFLTDTDDVSALFPTAVKVAGPTRDAAGTSLTVFRLPGDNPEAWVTPVIVKAPDEQALATVRNPRFDPLMAAVFDTGAKVTGQNVTTPPTPLALTVSTTHYEPGHIAFKLSGPAPAGSALVVSENYYPGWTASVDGKLTPASRVDYTLIGVPLTPGATSVDLQFSSSAFDDGAFITVVVALGALIWWAITFVQDRRRHG